MIFHIKRFASCVALGASMLYGSTNSTAQHIRSDRLSLSTGIGFGMSANQNELDGISVKFDFAPSGSINYLKNVNPFLDIRLGLGIQGLMFNGFQLQEDAVNFTVDFPKGGLALFTEIVPIYFTNPNRLGYLQSDFLFYLGTGVGVIRSFSGQNHSPVLTENELAKAEFGFDSPLQKVPSRSNLYVPIIIGIEENKTKRSWRFGAEVASSLFLISNPITGSNIFPGWFQFKITATKIRL